MPCFIHLCWGFPSENGKENQLSPFVPPLFFCFEASCCLISAEYSKIGLYFLKEKRQLKSHFGDWEDVLSLSFHQVGYGDVSTFIKIRGGANHDQKCIKTLSTKPTPNMSVLRSVSFFFEGQVLLGGLHPRNLT